MVSYPIGELCNTLGNLLNGCTSKSINSAQIYPPLNHSLCDAMCNEEWSELMHNLRELPGGFLHVCVMFHSGEMIRFAIG